MLYSVSKVDRHLRAVIHYADGEKTLCGKRVGTLAQRWFAPMAWEPANKYGAATCAGCAARFAATREEVAATG